MRVFNSVRVTVRPCPSLGARLPVAVDAPKHFANEIGYADLLTGIRALAPPQRCASHVFIPKRQFQNTAQHCGHARRPNNLAASTLSSKPLDPTNTKAWKPMRRAREASLESSIRDEQDESRYIDLLEHADYETLCFESGVEIQPTFKCPRLIDNAANALNFRLWADLLEFRSRIDGTYGVKCIWREMIARAKPIPTSGDLADRIWGTTVTFALGDEDFLTELVSDVTIIAIHTRRTWRHLYDSIVGNVLKTHPETAFQWHLRLGFTFDYPRSIENVVDSAVASSQALGVLPRICKSETAPKLHDKLIPRLCDEGNYGAALTWHRFLIERDDLPTSTCVIEPLIQHLTSGGFDEEIKAIDEKMASAGVPTEGPIRDASSLLQSAGNESVQHDIEDHFGSQDLYAGDAFLARLFATKALGIHLLINAVAAFGSRRLGPLAMQQIALRCVHATELRETLEIADNAGLEIEPHSYSRVLQVVASSNYNAILKSIRDSDMHPDAFEDVDTQQRLLRYFVSRKRLVDVHRTLLILGARASDRDNLHGNNLLLAYVSLDQRTAALQFLDDILNEGHSVTESTQLALQSLLVPRVIDGSRGGHPMEIRLNDLDFLLKILLRVAQAGGEITPYIWSPILQFYGKSARQADLEYLAIWLAHHYSSHLRAPASIPSSLTAGKQDSTVSSTVVQRNIPKGHESHHPLSTIFNAPVVRAIIESSFKNLGRPVHRISRLPLIIRGTESTELKEALAGVPLHCRGLALVKMLRDRYNVYVNTHTLRRIILHRLVQLYGKGESRDRQNRLARFKNHIMLGTMARQLHEVWNQKLWDLPNTLLKEEDEASRLGLEAALIGPHNTSKSSGFLLRKVAHRPREHWLMYGKAYRKRLYAHKNGHKQ